VVVADGGNALWRALAGRATLVVHAWDCVPRLPSCERWVFAVLPSPAVSGVALGLGLKAKTRAHAEHATPPQERGHPGHTRGGVLVFTLFPSPSLRNLSAGASSSWLITWAPV
jgi:hypothetical protein